MITRRKFVAHSTLFAFAASLPFTAKAKSYRMGYSAITWGGKDEQAITDISNLGYRGIQLRANSYKAYQQNPAELKAKIDAAKLSLVMFSSGNVEIDPTKVEANIEQHVNHAQFVKALGGTSIQLTNSLRKNNVAPTADELAQLAAVMNEIGKRTQAFGIQTTYHNHMHQYGETPEEVDALVKAMNPKYTRLLLDVAHYFQGGGNPAEAIIKYKNIISAFHIKDVKQFENKKYQFVELGQGSVDLKAVFKSIDQIKFSGWAIVELDSVPDKAKTPYECAQISKDFLQSSISYQF